jgi:hypothetical protein
MRSVKQHVLSGLALVALALVPFGLVNAQVTVTAADPPTAPQGTVSLDVAVTGNGFDSTAQVSFLVTGTTNAGGITVRKVVVKGPKKLIATVDIADTAVVAKFDIEVKLSNGRKGKGTTLFSVQAKVSGDPCATPDLDFPAFTYAQQSGSTQQIFVVDATGACSRPLYLVSEGFSAQLSAFSYPIAGSANRGRVVWLEGTQVVGGDFTVSGTSVSVDPRRTIVSSVDCCALELSRDGRNVYVSTAQSRLERILVSDPSSRVLIKTIADDGWFNDGSVNGDESAFYVEEQRMSGGQVTGRELVRIDLITLQANVVRTSGIARFWAGADPNSNLIAYTDYVVGSNNCYLLQIADGTTGQLISYGQPRYGVNSTWYGGRILTNGYKPPKGAGRCDSMNAITEIDPDTSAERILRPGYYPDGR